MDFVTTMEVVLKTSNTKYVVLGDSQHGLKSLKCLAAAVRDGALRRLDRYGVSTVLFEGARAGDELTHHGGEFRAAVQLLRVGGAVRVSGCEDDRSLATKTRGKALMQRGATPGRENEWIQEVNTVMDERVPDANEAWFAQAQLFGGKVILCVGTSHLPQYTHVAHGHVGLEAKLKTKGTTYAFAVEASNSPGGNKYEPERGHGFGKVPSIDDYPGWDQIP